MYSCVPACCGGNIAGTESPALLVRSVDMIDKDGPGCPNANDRELKHAQLAETHELQAPLLFHDKLGMTKS